MKKKKKERIKESKKIKNLNKLFILSFILLSFIYYAPLLTGKKMMGGSDFLLAGYRERDWGVKVFKDFKELPRWDPSMFGGVPKDNPYHLHRFWYFLFPTHLGWTYLFVLGTILSGVGLYLYLKELKVRECFAFIGGVIYMNSGYVLTMSSPGHDGKILAMGVIPFIFLTLHKAIKRKTFTHFLLAGGIGGVAAVNTHFQYIYYTVIMVVFYFLFQLIWRRKENGFLGSLKLIGKGVSGVLLAIGIVTVHYAPTLGGIEWGIRGHERGYEFATSWSLPPMELIDIINPYFSGILENYWGENYFKLHSEYIGMVGVILLLLGVLQIKTPVCRFFLISIIITIIFALGGHTPFYRLPYHLLPMLKKFRGPSMIFGLTTFGVAVIGGMVLNEMKEKNVKVMKKIAIIGGITLILLWVISLTAKDWIVGKLEEWLQLNIGKAWGKMMVVEKIKNLNQNYSLIVKGWLRGVVFWVIYFTVIWGMVKEKVGKNLFPLIITPIMLIDSWSITKKFLKITPPPEKYYEEDEVVWYLKNKKGLFRVYPLYYEHHNDCYLALHGIQSVGGNVGNPYKRYQEFIGAKETVMFKPYNLIKMRPIMNMLNVKYVLSLWFPPDLENYPEKVRKNIISLKQRFNLTWGIPWEEAHKGLKLIYKSHTGRGIYENEECMDRVWVVYDYLVMKEDEVLKKIKHPSFNPKEVVILEEKPSINLTPTHGKREATLEITHYSPNKIVTKVNLPTSGILVFSENYHPNWKAYVDGEEHKVYRGNYIFRAVPVEEGTHIVELKYECPYLNYGKYISLFSYILFLGVIIFSLKIKVN